jgi:integrase
MRTRPRAGPGRPCTATRWSGSITTRVGAHDVINERTRREYRRLLITYALVYFAPDERLRDLDERRLRGFVDWLCRQDGPDGHRLCDRSVYNAVLPLRACLRHAHGAGLPVGDVGAAIVLPSRRRGRAYEFDERRFLTKQQLARLLAEIPEQWRTLFELLASTGLRISEAIGLRVMDAGLEADAPFVHVRRAIVNGQLTAPKSRHGRRTIPISLELADRLRELVASRGETELLFRGAQGAALRAGNLRYRVLVPAARRAGLPWARFHTLRHTCAAILIDAGASPLPRQRWMGHHSAAFTLDTYGHLLRDDLGPHLELGLEITVKPRRNRVVVTSHLEPPLERRGRANHPRG